MPLLLITFKYQKYIEKDAALERRFQPVLINEPTVDQTIQILQGIRERYEAHHRLKISEEALMQEELSILGPDLVYERALDA